MKKFELTIPKPCHENWDAMTPEAKGRFCGSCQKTVVDFTNMSDRQLAEFFKKPTGSVCGRFNTEQLNHTLEVPRKRIPWIKYFFTIALPAFLVSLKANSQKVTMGKPSIENLQMVDTAKSLQLVKQKHRKPSARNVAKHYKIEKIKSEDYSSIIKPFLIQPKEVLANETQVCNSAMSLSGVLGGVVISRPIRVRKDVSLMSDRRSDSVFTKFSVYPNPAKVNSPLTIDLKNIEAGDYAISIINSDGALVQLEKMDVQKKMKQTSFTLNDISAGPYFIRLTNTKNNKTYTEIIVVQ